MSTPLGQCGFVCLPVSAAVVIRSTLAPFDCTSHDGVRTMDADPSIVCDSPTGPHYRMVRVAGLMLILYALGIPCLFALILLRHRRGIRFDQVLKQRGEGESPLTNPYLHLRRRYGKLYSDYKPELSWWRLILFLRFGGPVCPLALALLVFVSPQRPPPPPLPSHCSLLPLFLFSLSLPLSPFSAFLVASVLVELEDCV